MTLINPNIQKSNKFTLKDESYFLLIAYNGLLFIPKMLLNFLYPI